MKYTLILPNNKTKILIMKHTLDRIESKPTNYKICFECGIINWCENETCHICQGNSFDEDQDAVFKYIKDEYDFYENEGYTKKEIKQLTIEI